MNILKIVITSTLLFLFQIAFSQNEKKFDFDYYKIGLKKENISESEKIKNWLIRSMTNDEKSICTKSCAEYYGDIPDELDLENEEKPGTIKKSFYKKWSSTRDMYRIPGVQPFEIGNGVATKCTLLTLCLLALNQMNIILT